MFPLGETTPNSLDRCQWLRIADQIALMNGAKTCVKKKTLLVVNLSSGPTAIIEPLAVNFSVVRYGKFADTAPKSAVADAGTFALVFSQFLISPF
jgi:hypothetical protein